MEEDMSGASAGRSLVAETNGITLQRLSYPLWICGRHGRRAADDQAGAVAAVKCSSGVRASLVEGSPRIPGSLCAFGLIEWMAGTCRRNDALKAHAILVKTLSGRRRSCTRPCTFMTVFRRSP